MSAAEALEAARAAGVELHVDGRDLVLNAAAEPPRRVVDLVTRHKAGVIAILRASEDDWSADDWRAFYDERAAIAEYDGGLPRREAEARAYEYCVVEWLNRHPVCSSPDRCLECGQGERSHEPLVPFGTSKTGHAWLHHACWDAWHARRKKEATAALEALGIEDGSGER